MRSFERLSPREREVLHLTVEGLTSKEIATRLGISPRTAEAHRAHLMHKLGVRNRVELIRYAAELGIVPVEK
ncbi:MAG: response regulator transcription factor [Gemmatimonadetes bacterium]|nr:response regulator transcription factor [Gemmatimonadota bacterium]